MTLLRRSARAGWAWGAAAAVTVTALVVAGCGGASTSKAAMPTTSTTVVVSGYAPTTVLGWVMPTLQNGASLVTTLPTTATDAEVAAGAQQLGVACGVSLKELSQATWKGAANRDERALAATVTRLQSLIATPPATGLGATLRPLVSTMNDELGALQRDLS